MITHRHTAWKRVVVALSVTLVLAAPAGGGAVAAGEEETVRFRGLRLSDALQQLQNDGLKIIYSSDLVLPDMIVTEEPRARWPHQVLAELLAPHGLQSKPGPAGVLLVVKAPPPGAIEGVVRLAGSSKPLRGVRIVVLEIGVETVTDARGRFTAGALPGGTYAMEATGPGYLPQTLDGVPVNPNRVTQVRFELNPRHVSVEEIVVRANDPSARSGRPEAREFMRREEIQRSPEFTHDPLRQVRRLPGVSGSDASGDLNVRGGSGDEVKIVLDGLELYEPYHLKDRGGPISIIDSRNVGGLGLLGGAFPAEYGGHLSAVVELDSAEPADELWTGFAVSSDDARIVSQGALGERGNWLVSGRRGDPSRYLDALGADPGYGPEYSDVFGRLGYNLDARTSLTLNVLNASDDLAGNDGALLLAVEEPGTFKSRHRNRYAWMTLEHTWYPRLFSQTIVSVGQLSSLRYGSSPRVTQVDDLRSTEVLGLKQDWLMSSGRHLVKWGIDLKRLRAEYRYASVSDAVDPGPEATSAGTSADRQIDTNPSGGDYGLYAADRLRVLPSLDVELGVRWDVQTYTPARDSSLSPRLNVSYAVGERITLRAGWGYFYQPQKIHQLQVEDGLEEFFPAERAEHRLISVERESDSGLLLQLTAYQKLMDDLRPRFENLFDPFGFFPEADGDRVRIDPESARAVGLELMARGPAKNKLDWWAGYTLARAEDEIDGDWVPRSWDHRHKLDFGLNFRPGDRWNLGLAGTYHSGRPTTALGAEVRDLPDGSQEIVPIIGARNGERFPAYHRMDLRISRSVAIKGTELTAFVNVTNLYDRENACCVRGLDLETGEDGNVSVRPDYRYGLPRMLTFGLAWGF